MLRLEKISSGYRMKSYINNVNLRLENGESLTVLGGCGCGKSTLLKTAAGLLYPICGSVFIDEAPITEFSRKELFGKIAYVPQVHAASLVPVRDFLIYSRIPYVNFGKPISEADMAIVEETAQLLNLKPIFAVPLMNLTEYQKRLVYIASAMVQGSDIILLDEPASFLNGEEKYKIMSVILMLKSLGKTVMTAWRDLDSVSKFSDRVVILDKGKIISDSPSVHMPSYSFSNAPVSSTVLM